MIYDAYPNELKTEHIQSLAVNLNTFYIVLKLCLFAKRLDPHNEGPPQPPCPPHAFFPQLKELVIVIEDSDEGRLHIDFPSCDENMYLRSMYQRSRLQELFPNPTVAIEKYITKCIDKPTRLYKGEESDHNVGSRLPCAEFPTVVVLAKSMLVPYVEGGKKVQPLF
jgi:hypothetical protein